MIIGHLSDLHVVEPGQLLYGEIDTIAISKMAVDRLRTLLPAVDAVVVTGDVTEHGTAAEYEAAREVLDGLGVPYFVIPGNHDRRDAFVAGFPDQAWTNADGFVQYAVDDFDVRLVGIDTLEEGEEHGRLCDRRLRWLDETLDAEPAAPTIILLHHPPFETGVWWMDTRGLAGVEGLRSVIDRHPQVALLACGHVHRPIAASLGHARVALAPSTAYHIHLDLTPEARPSASFEPRSLLVHASMPGGIVTHQLFVRVDAPPVELLPPTADWDSIKREWTERAATLRPAP